VYTMGSGVMLVGATVPTAGVLRKAGGRNYWFMMVESISWVRVLN
jgi:hypothetical protein